MSHDEVSWALETALRGYLSTSDRPAIDLEAAARELFSALGTAAARADDEQRPAIEACRAKFQTAIGRILSEQAGTASEANGLAFIAGGDTTPKA